MSFILLFSIQVSAKKIFRDFTYRLRLLMETFQHRFTWIMEICGSQNNVK